ncbi:MAG: hypothetical protein WC829_18200 [Hyphomicrobium sp.]|jgi:hypothetical protein
MDDKDLERRRRAAPLPSKAQQLLQLAEQCEREEPHALLDAAIYAALFGPIDLVDVAPCYTTNLRDATTLVPEDDADTPWFWRVGHDGEGPDPSRFKAELLACSALPPEQDT